MRRAVFVFGHIVVFLAGLMVGMQFGWRKPDVSTIEVGRKPGHTAQENSLPEQPEEQPPLPDENRMLAKAPRPEVVLPELLEKRVTPAADAGNGIKLVPAKHDYGKVMEGEARTHTFKVKCPPDATLRLGRLYSPCPCIAVRAAKREIPAGEEANIEVAIDTPLAGTVITMFILKHPRDPQEAGFSPRGVCARSVAGCLRKEH